MRITKIDLQHLLDSINEATGNEKDAWTQGTDGTHRCNVGTYVLDWCNGGVRLGQMNDGGGVRAFTQRSSKSETYQRMHAFLCGIQTQTSQGVTQ